MDNPAFIKIAGYENIVVTCPKCQTDNTYNRISDLKCNGIFHGAVSCLQESCAYEFLVSGDNINEKHRKILMDAYRLIDQKNYQSAIIKICQAYEAYFSYYVKFHFYSRDQHYSSKELDAYNKKLADMSKKIEKYTFFKMREIFVFLNLSEDNSLSSDNFTELCDAYFPKNITNLEKKNIFFEKVDKLQNSYLRDMLKSLLECDIDVKRNAAVHKDAVRPHSDVANFQYKTANEIISFFETRDILQSSFSRS